MVIKRECPVCHKVTTKTITPKEYKAYEDYTYLGGTIKDYDEDISESLADFLETGICDNCVIAHSAGKRY